MGRGLESALAADRWTGWQGAGCGACQSRTIVVTIPPARGTTPRQVYPRTSCGGYHMRIRGISSLGWLFIALIAILLFVNAAPWLIGTAHPRPLRSITRSIVKSVSVACEAYKFDLGHFPPDKIIINGKTLSSSESLAWHLTRQLTAPVKSGEKSGQVVGPYLDPSSRHVADTDKNGFMELLDAWGKPLIYDNIVDDPGGFDSLGDVDPRRDGRPRHPDSFDIFTQSDGVSVTNWAGDQ
jgi:hypothetical protein